MARKEIVEYTDDLDGSSTDDVQTVRLSYGSRTVDVDLGAKNRSKLEKYLTPYLEAGRRVSASRGGARGGTHGLTEDVKAIRDWARAQGLDVSERGRISKTIRDAFDAAH
jgi:hypothetical protein